MNKLVIILALSGLFLMGCTTVKNEIEVSSADDDGVAFVTSQQGDVFSGLLFGSSEDIFSGVIDGLGNDIDYRSLYRFSMDKWTGGDIIVKIKCTNINGNPGTLEAYVVDNFGAIPVPESNTPVDISSVWNLVNSGEKVAELEPAIGDWMEITITKDIIESRLSGDNYIAIALKISDETVIGGNHYYLNSYEYGEKNKELKPYFLNVAAE